MHAMHSSERSEQSEGEGLVDRKCCTNTEVDGDESSGQEDRHRHRTTERVLELVEALDERNKHQTKGNQGLQSNAQ